MSIKLIMTDFEHYANKEIGMSQNFKYPALFIRKTKKAYLTVYNDTILKIAHNAASPNNAAKRKRRSLLSYSWMAIRSQLKRRG